MAKRRRPKLVQVTPDMPPVSFAVVERQPGINYWHFRIADAIVGDEPEFTHAPTKTGYQFSIQELASRAAGELNEARGTVAMQEFRDGIPTFSAVFASNGRQVFCIRSTDHERAKPVDLTAAYKWLVERGAK